VMLVGETGALLQTIVTQIGIVNLQVGDIATAAGTQATSLAQINNAVSDMDRVTQQNAAMVEQSTAAARSLAHEAGELGELVAPFQLDPPAGGRPAIVTDLRSKLARAPADRGLPRVQGNLALQHDAAEWAEF